MLRNIYSPEFKEKIVKEYLEENCSIRDIATKYEVNEKTLEYWVLLYRRANNLTHKRAKNQLTKPKMIDITSSVVSINSFDKINFKMDNRNFEVDKKDLRAFLEALIS